MINHGIIYGSTEPKSIEITDSAVFIAKDIAPHQLEEEGHLIKGFKYEYIQYDKNEYIEYIASQNAELQAQLINTQVALCDLYEGLEGVE